MKLNGRKPSQKVSYFSIPRPEGDFVFTIKSIKDYKDFDKLCPAPKPPKGLKPGGVSVELVNDPVYLGEIKQHNDKQIAWTILESIKDTPDVTWEQVNLNDSNTWLLYEQELLDSGFTRGEVQRLVSEIMDVNVLSEQAIEEARQRFLLSRTKDEKSLSFLPAEQNTTPSGEPAKDLA